ncbi:MAG TPA: helix-turn-helix transcriptional regulator [Chitinophagales bacterium]|nr:helix-turn-helix transcriptional regulator [Chitinophagales bacterium]
MSVTLKELDALHMQIHENRKVLQFSGNITLDNLKKICDGSLQMVSIFELGQYSYSMVHCNKSAYAFLGVNEQEINNMGFKYILKIIHPENITAVYRLIQYFKNPANYNKVFSYTFYLHSSNGWEWTYASVKPSTFNTDGSVKYMIGVGCSINHLMKTKRQFKLFRKDLDFFEENLEKYLSMTEREKEILKLITNEYSSVQIAEKLSISPYTVDTHRKNLIEKLEVKSSIGLAKYAIIFNLV